jgi:uncharacterized protein YecT (DUF1311 family)
MLEKIIFLILGALFSALAYMLKRRFERKPTLESLDIKAKLLLLHKEMQTQGLTPQDLSNLEMELTEKPRAIQRHAQRLEKVARPVLERKPEGDFLTQAEMNARASENLETAKLQMEQVLDELEPLLDEAEMNALKRAQTAWESYCVEQSEAAAASYRGGSIQPLIFLSELERITVDRTARLQADLDEQRKLKR